MATCCVASGQKGIGSVTNLARLVQVTCGKLVRRQELLNGLCVNLSRLMERACLLQPRHPAQALPERLPPGHQVLRAGWSVAGSFPQNGLPHIVEWRYCCFCSKPEHLLTADSVQG